MNNYTIRKIFDCQEMPDTLRKEFFKLTEQGNDSYIDWVIASEEFEDDDKSEHRKAIDAIDQWLINNGAEPGTTDDCGEEVLIKHWW